MKGLVLAVALCAIAYAAQPDQQKALAPNAELSRMQAVAQSDHTRFANTAAAGEHPVAFAADKAPAQPEAKPAAKPAEQPAAVVFQATTGGTALSTAGKCYLSLAVLFFFINAVIYVAEQMEKYNVNTYVEGQEMWNTLCDIILNKERLQNAKGALLFIPVLAVLMLFIMFRAKVQNFEGTGLVPANIQWCMVLASTGIYLQALDIIDIRITSEAFGNLSKTFGFLFLYIGYTGCVYGLFTVKDPAKPLSVAAQCILALCTLALILRLVVVFLENNVLQKMKDSAPAIPKLPLPVPSIPGMAAGAPAGAPGTAFAIPGGDLVADMFNPVKLQMCDTICELVPLVAMVYMFVHIHTVHTQGEAARPPDWARMGMYCGMAGIYVQSAAVLLLRDLNKTLGTVARSVGLLITYAGFIVTLVYALSITPGETGNVGVLGMLYMCSAILVFKALTVALEEVSDIDSVKDKFEGLQSYKATMQSAGTVLQYATILGILMIYIHFRAAIILELPSLPDWVTYSEVLAMLCLLLQVLMVFIGGALGDNTVTGLLKIVTMLGVYVGFFGIVVAAMTLDKV